MTIDFVANALFGVTAVGYVLASSLFLRFLIRGEKDVGALAPRAMTFSVIAHGANILAASTALHVCPASGIHFPMSVASMLMGVAYLFARKRFRLDVAGAFIAPLALASLMASRFVGHGVEPPENFKSAVLPFHITANLLGIAFFGLSFSAAALYLVQERLVKQKRIDGLSRRLPPLDALDRAEHRFLLAGFPLLTIGLLLGTFFGGGRLDLDLGSDLLRVVFGYASWLFIAAVLFLRSVAGWRGKRAAYGTIAGFGFAVSVLVVYLLRQDPRSAAAIEPLSQAARAVAMVRVP